MAHILVAPVEGDEYYQKLTGFHRYEGHVETADRVRVAVAALQDIASVSHFDYAPFDRSDIERILHYSHTARAINDLNLKPSLAEDFDQRESTFLDASLYTVAMTKRVIERVLDSSGPHYGFAFGRPAGHHSKVDEIKFSGNCGANYVMALAGWLASEQGRTVGVFDMDVHFAQGSHDILSWMVKEKPDIKVYHSDVSSFWWSAEDGIPALESGHSIIFSTELARRLQEDAYGKRDQLVHAMSRSATNPDTINSTADVAALFPFTSELDDTALIWATIRTISYFTQKGVDFILLSFGLDAEYGELTPAPKVTWLGYWQMGRICRASGFRCVFALEGGGYMNFFDDVFGQPLTKNILGEVVDDKRDTIYAENIRAVARGLRGESLAEGGKVEASEAQGIEGVVDSMIAIGSSESVDATDQFLSLTRSLEARLVRALTHFNEELAVKVYSEEAVARCKET